MSKFFKIILATALIGCSPNSAKSYYKTGDEYSLKGDYDNAIADYTEAIRLDSNYAEAYNKRGDVYLVIKRDNDSAIADYTEAIRLNPNKTEAYLGRGASYFIKGNRDRAIADCEAVLRIDPNDTQARSVIEAIRKME